ncbi:hypothetical protein PVAP13_5KG091187 [Panicum virgatum]|uniref:Uncharacterized protein n=1 Tax=Panicum virgatum TaxID=38727 RepID=A0A8T0SHA5_PANVG|nr:hypothetical protein PVAP13_5KG091187 [Panicum virgatum]
MDIYSHTHTGFSPQSLRSAPRRRASAAACVGGRAAPVLCRSDRRQPLRDRAASVTPPRRSDEERQAAPRPSSAPRRGAPRLRPPHRGRADSCPLARWPRLLAVARRLRDDTGGGGLPSLAPLLHSGRRWQVAPAWPLAVAPGTPLAPGLARVYPSLLPGRLPARRRPQGEPTLSPP